MTKSKINTVKLQKALQKFDSLDKANEALESNEQRLTSAIQALEVDLEVKKEAKAKYQ